MAEKKNQHYVPKHYLRRFCSAGEQITLCHLRTGRIIEKASISGQCSDDYFYGADLVVETALGDLEGSDQQLFEEICTSQKLPTDLAKLGQLHAATGYFHLRTKQSAEAMMKGQTAILTEMARRAAREHLPHISAKTIESLTVSPANAPAQGVALAGDMFPMIMDLDRRLLIAPEGREFITSDHPVVAVNQGLQDRAGDLSYTGLALQGLQLFFPLSPQLCVMLFDGGCYRVGRPGKREIVLQREEDVDVINSLQILNAGDTLYFHSPAERGRVLALRNKLHASRLSKADMLVREEDRSGGLLMGMKKAHFKIPGTWSFCKVRSIPQFAPRESSLERLYPDFDEYKWTTGKKMSFFEWVALYRSGQLSTAHPQKPAGV